MRSSHLSVSFFPDLVLPCSVLLLHWPVPLNPNGNHPLFPTKPDGSRDIDEERELKDTWKDLEEVQKKGAHASYNI